MNQRTITLSGQTYTIKELPRKKNAAWRARFQERFGALANVLEVAKAASRDHEIGIADLTMRVQAGISAGMDSVDNIWEMLCEYSPEVAADRDRLEEEAYDSEIVSAFVVVLGLAYPFGTAVTRLISLSSNGQQTKEI